jgi:hypothetical protein
MTARHGILIAIDAILIGLMKPVSWFIFGGMTLLTIMVGLILTYHWKRYGMNAGMSFASILVFAIGAGVLLLSLLGATIAINLS